MRGAQEETRGVNPGIVVADSAVCGAAFSLGMIIFGRVIQGAGGGVLVPLSQAVFLESFPPALMVSYLAPYDPAFQGWLQNLQGFFASHGDPVAALREAYAVIYRTLIEQATLWAYIENFRFLACLSLCGVPMALLFKKAVRKKVARGPVAD